MSKLSKMNEMAIQQITGYCSAYNGASIEDLVMSMALDASEWLIIRPECAEWLPNKLVIEIDEYFLEQLPQSPNHSEGKINALGVKGEIV